MHVKASSIGVNKVDHGNPLDLKMTLNLHVCRALAISRRLYSPGVFGEHHHVPHCSTSPMSSPSARPMYTTRPPRSFSSFSTTWAYLRRGKGGLHRKAYRLKYD